MTLSEKIKGTIYGTALGDALGLGNEFMTRHEVKAYYPGGLRHFNQIIRDAHRSMFRRGEWTNDTETVLHLFESVIRKGGFDILDLAASLKSWYEEGTDDMSPVMRQVISTPGWSESPVSVSHHIWRANPKMEASNEAIIRSIVTGLTSSRRDLYMHTTQLVQATHDDTRCIASAYMIALAMHSLLHHDSLPDFDKMRESCEAVDTRTLPYLEVAYEGTLEDLVLDDEDTLCYTRKAMASALWSMWHCDNANDAIYSVIDQGGDADTNAALAGAIAGLRFGFNELPEEKNLIIGKEYLDDISGRLEKHIAEHVLH